MEYDSDKPLRACVTTQAPRLYIDGVPVDRLFDQIYAEFQASATASCIAVHYEVIAWTPLVVAADRAALRHALCELLASSLNASDQGDVVLRAYPSEDDICVVFEVLDARPAPRTTADLQRWDRSLLAARRRVEAMGGELAVFARDTGGACVSFWLPQWVVCDIEETPSPSRAA